MGHNRKVLISLILISCLNNLQNRQCKEIKTAILKVNTHISLEVITESHTMEIDLSFFLIVHFFFF